MCSDRIDNTGIECTVCKDTITINALIHLLQAIVTLQTPGNAQNANLLTLDQEVAVDFKTDIICLLTHTYSY